MIPLVARSLKGSDMSDKHKAPGVAGTIVKLSGSVLGLSVVPEARETRLFVLIHCPLPSQPDRRVEDERQPRL
jgi:hypothetical protein